MKRALFVLLCLLPHAACADAPAVIPLAVDLARAGQNKLALSARLRPTRTDMALTVGANGSIVSKSANVTGQINYAPRLPSSTDTASEISRASMAVQAHAGSAALSLSGELARAGQNAGPDAPAALGTQTVTVRASAAPLQTLHADGQWTQTTPLDNDAPATPTTKMQVDVTYAPAAALSVVVQTTQTQAGDTQTMRQEAAVNVTPLAALSLSAGTAQARSDTSQFTLTTVGGTVRMGRVAKLSGAWRGRQASPSDVNPADALDTAQARVTLSPCAGFSVFGTHAQNPDGGSDVAQQRVQNGLGVDAQAGALSLGGDWAASAGPNALPEQTVRVHLGLTLSGATRVSGSLTQTLVGTDGAASGTNLYTLGLSHVLADRVTFSLSGMAKTAVGASVPVSPDLTANAALGLRF